MRYLVRIVLPLLLIVLLPVAAATQTLPDNPQPALPDASPPASPDPGWLRIQHFANGEAVLVRSTYGPALHCRFAGATEAYLFCDPDDAPAGTGYRFDRSSVIGVSVERPERRNHVGVLVAVATGGILTGLSAARSTDAGTAAIAGLIGAGVTGAIGYPMSQMQPERAGWGLEYRLRGFNGRNRTWTPHSRMSLPLMRLFPR